MKSQLLRAIKRNQCRHGYKATITLGELASLPNVAEEDVIDQVDQFRGEAAKHLLCS